MKEDIEKVQVCSLTIVSKCIWRLKQILSQDRNRKRPCKQYDEKIVKTHTNFFMCVEDWDSPILEIIQVHWNWIIIY